MDMDLAGFTAGLIAIVGLMAWVLWNTQFVALPEEIEMGEKIGGVAACEVFITSVGGRRMVEFALVNGDGDRNPELHVYLNASQARLLSEWILGAATPGRTLADARRPTRIDKPTP